MDNWYGAYEIGRERGADILRFAEVERLARRSRRSVGAARLGLRVLVISLAQGMLFSRGSKTDRHA